MFYDFDRCASTICLRNPQDSTLDFLKTVILGGGLGFSSLVYVRLKRFQTYHQFGHVSTFS